jgi:DNA modification methylase
MEVKCAHDELVDIHKLVANPKNPNKHPKKQIDALAYIIKSQGQRAPIVVSTRSGFITKGHGRLEAIKQLGWTQCAVDYQDYESEAQEYADMIADNKIAELAEHDDAMMVVDLKNLPDLDLKLLGMPDFSMPTEIEAPVGDPDEVPEVEESKVVRGEVYILGNHRLMCGDSTSITDVEKLMNGEKADMVFTDPPYNTGMSSKTNRDSTRLNHMFDDAYTDEEWKTFLNLMSANYWILTKDNCAVYMSLDWRRSHELVPEMKMAGFKFSNLIVWDKIVHGLGSDYQYTHEFIHVFKKGKPEIDSHQGDKEYQDVWRIQRKIGKDRDHATKKPLELCERAINHASKSGMIVVDLFGGSGSTLIACEKTNRKCFMMEFEPHYIAVILERWQKYTGKKAKRDDGKLWDEIKAGV